MILFLTMLILKKVQNIFLFNCTDINHFSDDKESFNSTAPFYGRSNKYIINAINANINQKYNSAIFTSKFVSSRDNDNKFLFDTLSTIHSDAVIYFFVHAVVPDFADSVIASSSFVFQKFEHEKHNQPSDPSLN